MKTTLRNLSLPLTILMMVAVTSLCLCSTSCTTTQHKAAFNTLYSVQKVTIGAYDGYIDSVIAGISKTNDVPKVSKAFNHFQAAYLVALDAVEFNTNALAPSSLVVESQDVINLIIQVKGK